MAEIAISKERIDAIRRALLNWYQVNARDLPWRHTRDPYRVLVSEVMLQQTQVDRVIPYYERFLDHFPTVSTLAAAPAAEVIKFWSGLGYNRRAVNLQRAAKAVVAQFAGEFPTEPDILKTLPGIGAYTAGAIAAFAYEQDVAFLDTNMRRVISRLIFGSAPISEAKTLEVAKALVPPEKGWSWNQALIEFGALQCTARRPACVICPLQSECAAFPFVQSEIATKRRVPSEKFETSSRFYRGRIVDALRMLPIGNVNGIEISALGEQVRPGFTNEDLPWLRGLVEGLQRDGLAHLAEESPAYDADESYERHSVRVKLP